MLQPVTAATGSSSNSSRVAALAASVVLSQLIWCYSQTTWHGYVMLQHVLCSPHLTWLTVKGLAVLQQDG
jgi:hypothetical protein